MTRNLIFVILITACFTTCLGVSISREDAVAVGENWLHFISPGKNLIEVVSAQTVSDLTSPLYYIINARDGGFVLVAADDACQPILGYSDEGSFVYPVQSPEVAAWMKWYGEAISDCIARRLSNASILPLWNDIRAGVFTRWEQIRNVAPLLTTTWNQGYPYNVLCPADAAGPGGHVYAGCGAVAMAQIMRFWNYPFHGSGSHSYTSTYGTLSANFSQTYYNWANMPATCAAGNQDIPLLLNHCGISVDMEYSPTGSNSYGSVIASSYSQYFGYAPTSYRFKSNYSDSNWKNLIIADLNAGRPLLYRGEGSSGGHLFNLDGYQNTDYFHFNWGWGGAYNGYFYLTNLNPGSYTFTSYQGAIMNIYPAISAPASPVAQNAVYVPANQTSLCWTDSSSNEEGFYIERKTGTGGIWQQVGSAAANASSCLDSGLASNTWYYYRICAYNMAGKSAYSGEISVYSGIIGLTFRAFDLATGQEIMGADVCVNGSLSGYTTPCTLHNNEFTPGIYNCSAEGYGPWTPQMLELNILDGAREIDLFAMPYQEVPIEISIETDIGDNVELIWEGHPDAIEYNVYAANSPLPPDSPLWTEIAQTSEYDCTADASANRMFFRAEATTVMQQPEGFVLVGGSFQMGDTVDDGIGGTYELPVHNVSVAPFLICRSEVMQGEYAALMGINPSSGYGVGDEYPVYNVSWYAALKYCNLRSMAEGLTPCYSINGSTNPASWGNVPTSNTALWNLAVCNWDAEGYRLPTEAEWELAARGGSSYPDYLYSGSDFLDSVAWCSVNSGGATHPCGYMYCNGNSIFDMSGNVYEWCWDWYDAAYYSTSPQNNPIGPGTGIRRTVRGGYWNATSSYCRISYRYYYFPYTATITTGIRLCRSIP
jgi:formylglycine-generating enzyme required for sulfatase activity